MDGQGILPEGIRDDLRVPQELFHGSASILSGAIASIGFILKEAEFTFPGILANQFGVLAIVWPAILMIILQLIERTARSKNSEPLGVCSKNPLFQFVPRDLSSFKRPIALLRIAEGRTRDRASPRRKPFRPCSLLFWITWDDGAKARQTDGVFGNCVATHPK